ncbi:MAG TPA: enoyl-CoA hydratase/isomerase family protein [Bacteroidales bacterium]|nr:enoyl-CoA hydratase/isomerase family protein [Bacteroidales bacterium]
MNDLILFETQGNIGIISLNRPDKKNALSMELLGQLNDVLINVLENENVKVLIIKAFPDYFSAGGDFKEMLNVNGEEAELMSIKVQSLFSKFALMDIPVIAQLSGIVYGGGLELAMFCDIRIAAENVELCLPEAKYDIIPGAGGINMLARIIGVEHARYFLFTGEIIPQNLALNTGLIHEIVPNNVIDKRCIEIADKLADKNSEVLACIKRLLLNTSYQSVGDCMNTEAAEYRSLLERYGKQKIRAFFKK